MPKPRRSSAWRWLAAVALLGGVVYGAGRFVERGGLARLLRAAHPGWLAAAALLQAGTYLAQGEIWRAISRAAGRRLPMGEAFQLSLAKLFVDQTVPSGGVSGTAFAARALRRQGLSRGESLACVAINLTSYYAAYALALFAAAAAAARGRRSGELAVTAAVFLFIGAATSLLFHRLSSPRPGRQPRKPRALSRLAGSLRGADARLLRSPRLLSVCGAMQMIVIGLDATTLWALTLALGKPTPLPLVFSGFMLANVARTVSFVPGGLGPFEAGSVLALHKLAKVPVAAALSATLLFRLLSFWLPMIPGFFVSRKRA